MKKSFGFIISLVSISFLFGCDPEPDPTQGNQFLSLDAKIDEIIKRYDIPGAQIAIMKDERLVYQGSYGFADKESKLPVSNQNVFRIASVSKPITAIGIYKLAQDGLLALDDKVFGEGAILGTTFGTNPYSEAIKSITVRHLLEHKAGGWTNDGNDPMFSLLNYPQHQLIGYTLDTRPLDFQPGSTFLYSNFGYCILGRVIEAVSGESYEAYIRNNILEPSGITGMYIGNKTFSGEFENEVRYYNSHSDFSPYKIDVKRMDAGGGWVASATDLLRFMARIDRLPYKQDFLKEYYLFQMYFGFFNWIHNGAMSGTSAVLERVNDNFSFSVVANGNSNEFNTAIEAFRRAINDEIKSKRSWPDHDLFESN
jgi:CubicO group peptidase (beta-lactamase class C family)